MASDLLSWLADFFLQPQYFPVSGVREYILLPALVALVVSTFTSMAGVSGAFLLLPFKVSILNFTCPSVSPFAGECDHPLYSCLNGARHANA